MKNFYTKDLVPDEFKASIDDYTYGNPEISGHGRENLSIGKFCSIAGGVRILVGGGHDYTSFTTYPFDNIRESNGDLVWPTAAQADRSHRLEDIRVEIGNDVWIGCGVIILPGARIGDGAVIGAGAVVAKEVPPYGIVVGNPIRIIKFRFAPEQIQKLLEIRWWDWPEDKIREALPLLRDIDAFIKHYGEKTNR